MRKLLLSAMAIASVIVLAAPAQAASFKTLYHFKNKTDGGSPEGGVIQDAAGTLYGTTFQGGGATCTNSPDASAGCGTIYSLSQSGGFKVLATLTGPNGANGNSTPVLIGNTLYGTTSYGGAGSAGVVFSLHTDGTNYTLLHQFTGIDGSYPEALVAGTNGKLYGITQIGGSTNNGVLFSLTTSGVYTVLHTFTLPGGGNPVTLIAAPNGTLAGSGEFGGPTSAGCPEGCGTIFSYVPKTAAFTTLLTLPGSGAQGQIPYVGSFGPNGTIYAADTAFIFSLSQTTGFLPVVPINFYGIGNDPTAGPVYTPGGTLYGTLRDSVFTGNGVIYSVQNGVGQDVYIFAGSQEESGGGPMARPTLTKSGSLIGTTAYSAYCTYCGTIWEYTP